MTLKLVQNYDKYMIDLKKIDFGGCIKFDETLNNFTKYNITVTNSSSRLIFTNEDEFVNKKQEIFIKDILSKIKDTIRKDILLKYYYENKNYDVVDIRDSMFEQTRKLTNAIALENKPNLITCVRIAADISDSAGFNYTTKDINGNSIYRTGSLANTGIFVDPYIRFTDNKIIFFDEIGINITNLEISDDYYAYDFHVRNDISFNLAYNLDDVKKCKVLYVIDNDNQDALPIIKARKRDEKLNDLLNG